MQKQCGELQRIDECHTSYLGYQYPLLFPYGEDGYRPNVRHRDKGTNIRHFTDITQSEQNNKDIPWEEATKRNRLTIREGWPLEFNQDLMKHKHCCDQGDFINNFW